jgi:hypothetical protein
MEHTLFVAGPARPSAVEAALSPGHTPTWLPAPSVRGGVVGRFDGIVRKENTGEILWVI